MSSRCRLHGEELHRLQSWNFALTSLGSHRLHASSAEHRTTAHTLQCLLPYSSGRTCRKGTILLRPSEATSKHPRSRQGTDPWWFQRQSWSRHWSLERVLARHGVGNRDDNGRHYKHNLPAKRKFENNLDASTVETHLLDFVLVRRCDLKDVSHTRVIPRVSYRSTPCPLQTQPSFQTKTKEEWSQRKKN